MADQFLGFLNHVPNFLWNLLLAAGAVLVGWIIRFILSRSFQYYARVSGFFLIKSITKHLHTPVGYFLPLFMLSLALPFMRMQARYYNPVEKILEVLLTLVFAVLLINVLKILEDVVYHKYDLNKADNLEERKIRTQLQFVRKFVVALIVLVTVGIILLSFESMRRIGTGLLTGVGIGGIIIGFAAQKSLGNLLAGFQIAFTQPIRIDDALLVEGEFGRVEEITLTYVVLSLWDQRRMILPITYFVENPFQNWTRVSSELIGTVFLYLDYTIPVEELRKELTTLLEGNALWDKQVKALQVTDAKENNMEIRMLMSGRNSGEVFDLRCQIRENMIAFIQKNHPESLPKIRTEPGSEIAEP